MKIPNNGELQQIAFNHSSGIDFKDFMNLYKNVLQNDFLEIGTTLVPDNPLHFRHNLLERLEKLIMAIGDKIRDEKLQHDTNREAAKISALLLDKIDKYEYLTGKEILPLDPSRVIEQLIESNALIKKYHYDTEKDGTTLLEQKEISHKLIGERYDEILVLNKKVY